MYKRPLKSNKKKARVPRGTRAIDQSSRLDGVGVVGRQLAGATLGDIDRLFERKQGAVRLPTQFALGAPEALHVSCPLAGSCMDKPGNKPEGRYRRVDERVPPSTVPKLCGCLRPLRAVAPAVRVMLVSIVRIGAAAWAYALLAELRCLHEVSPL